jgi:hypothetical protein
MKARDYTAESRVYEGLRHIVLHSQRNWLEEYPAIEAMPIGESVDTEYGTITKVDQNLSHCFDFDYNHVWMIFEMEGRYFKYTGWKSSYGTSHWNDWVEEVQKKEETRVFYE